MFSGVISSAQYHRQHYSLHAFEQFEAVYVHNHNDKYQARPGLEPGNSRLQAPFNTSEPSGPARNAGEGIEKHILIGLNRYWDIIQPDFIRLTYESVKNFKLCNIVSRTCSNSQVD